MDLKENKKQRELLAAKKEELDTDDPKKTHLRALKEKVDQVSAPPIGQFADPNRDRQFDHQNVMELLKQTNKLKYVNKNVPQAQKILQNAKNVQKIVPGLSDHLSNQSVKTALDYVLPKDEGDTAKQQEVFDSFVRGSNEELNQAFTSSQQLALVELDRYRDKKAALGPGRQYVVNKLLQGMLTDDEQKRFDDLKTQGKATDEDMYKYKRQKMRAFTWREEQEGTREKVKSDFTSEYKKFISAQMKQDKKQERYFSTDYLMQNDEEFQRLKALDATKMPGTDE